MKRGQIAALIAPLVLIGCEGAPAFVDGWSPGQLAQIESLAITALPPIRPSPGNRVADSAAAARLGEVLFFDPCIAGAERACASCHVPALAFTDGLPRAASPAGAPSNRNTPSIVGAAWSYWQYWDGRRDSLWAQALLPIEAENEMAGSRVQLAADLGSPRYRELYAAAFGAPPPSFTLPPRAYTAAPLGSAADSAAWHDLPQGARREINRLFANAGKAIAAFERTLAPKPTRFDAYVASLRRRAPLAIDPSERLGISLFIDPERTQCLQCHNGPLLTNGAFHSVGSGRFVGAELDLGRIIGIQAALQDEFNCLGPYSDAASDADCVALRHLETGGHDDFAGRFKTPSLRNLSKTAPYFHDGRYPTLAAVIDHYVNPPIDNGQHELRPLGLNADERAALVAFLDMLTEPGHRAGPDQPFRSCGPRAHPPL
ncbi:MAG: cytochrome c peroxidase [Pseudomonadota bacterium]